MTLAAAAALIVFAVFGRSRAVSIATALAIPTAAVLLGNDWRAGAHFATIGRYATPVWLGLEILVTAGVLAGTRAEHTRTGAVCCTATIVLAGTVCLFADNRYPQWWDNNDNVPIVESAVAANASPHGIVIISELPLALSLSH